MGGTNRVSGKVWWETSKNGTTFPTSTSESFVTQTADEAKTGFRVVTSVLTPEGKAAIESTQNANNAYDKVKEQLAILKAHPEYVQETVVAPIVDGEYTAHFTDDIDVEAMYQFVINGDGEIQLAYSNFPILAYGSPREYTHSNPFITAGRQQVYNSHFALVPNLDKFNIDITNYDTTKNIALPGNTAVSDVQTIFNVGSTVEIVWSNKDGEISRTSVSTIDDAKKAAMFTVPSDIKENTIYTVELVVNGVTVDADSFLARLAEDADKYEPKAEPVEKPYGEATTEKDVTDAVTVPGYPTGGDQPEVTVDPGATLPDGTTPGTVEVPVTVTYPDGSKDQIKVPVTTLEKVIDRTDDPSQPTPAGYVRVTFEAGEGSFATDAKKVFDVKAGTAATEVPTPTVTAPTGKVQSGWNPELPANYDKAGTYTAQFKAQTTDADKYEPKAVGEKVDLTDNVTNLPELPKGTKVTDITPEGEIDTTTPGKYQGTIEVTYPDGSKDQIKIPVEVVDTIAPDKPKVDPIKPGDNEVTGKTEPNIDVTVKLPNGSEYYGSSDDKGIFKVKVPSLEAGDKVIVTATDKSGNTSEPTTAIVSPSNTEYVTSGENNKIITSPQRKLESGIGLPLQVGFKELPKTGESSNDMITISGGVVFLSMLGLLGYKKRKDNE